jgi:hypothetical protein
LIPLTLAHRVWHLWPLEAACGGKGIHSTEVS